VESDSGQVSPLRFAGTKAAVPFVNIVGESH
jgi:hypothetical protein